jgi:hypothetical protein
MRHLALLLLMCALLAQSALAAAPSFRSSEDVQLWLNTYRKKPEPKRLPEAVRTMAALGLFADQETSGVYVGFIAGVLGSNQLKAKKLLAGMLPASPDTQAAIVKAVAYSGLPTWRSLLNDLAAKMPERRILIDRFVLGEAKLLMELPLDNGPTLDTLWGFYLGTGTYEPVSRIISALELSNDRENVERLVVGSMAKWTLASNASRDQAVLDLCYVEVKHRPESIAKPLQEVIDAVEIAETGKIRKDAMAAIEELKQKGPETARTINWATQLGATAIALGCVVAGVTGHAELGVPCVVTGALTQAAGKVLSTPEGLGWMGLGGTK